MDRRLFALVLAGLAPRLAAQPENASGRTEMMAPLVVQDEAVCSFGFSFKCLGDPQTQTTYQLLVTDVTEDSRAQKFGLKGEKIIAVNGLKVSDLKGGMARDGALMRLFVDRKRGDSITVRIAGAPAREVTLYAIPSWRPPLP